LATIRELRAKFTATADGFRSSINSLRTNLQGIGTSTERAVDRSNSNIREFQRRLETLQRVLNNAGDPESFRDLNNVLREAQRELTETGTVGENGLQEIQRAVDQARTDFNQLGNSASDSIQEVENALNGLERELADLGSETNLGQLNRELDRVEENLEDVGNEAEEATREVAGAFDGLRGKLQGLVGLVAGVFAVDSIIDFTKTLLDTTGDLQALQGQYDQVMGAMKDSTDKYLGEMSSAWNKHPDELKKSYLQYVAILKSKGIAEEEAHTLAKQFLERTVDANAFANESMEETTARFMGGIKGEYDSLDTAMVNLSATMMNDIALNEYGKKFDELTVAQQETLKAQEMLRQHTSAGVLGQGEREAAAYANNVAMLKNNWREFLALIGGGLLNKANGKIKQLSDWIKTLDTEKIGKGLVAFVDTVEALVKTVYKIITWDALLPIVNGLATAFITFKTAMLTSTAVAWLTPWVIGLLNPMTRAAMFTQLWAKAQAFLNATLLANPIGLIIAIITGLTVAFITAYKTSETFRNFVNNTFESVKVTALKAAEVIKTATSELWQKAIESTEEFRRRISTFGASLQSSFQSAVTSIGGFFTDIGRSVADFFSKGLGEKVGEIGKEFIEQLKAGFSSFGGIVSLLAPTMTAIGLSIIGVSGPIGFIITAIVSLVSYLYRLSQTNEEVRNGLTTVWNGILSIISSVLKALQPIFEVFVQSFTQMSKELGPEFQKTGQMIAESFVQLQPAFQELGTAFRELFSTLVSLIPSFSQIIQAVLPIAIQLFGVLGQAIVEIAMTVIPLWAQVFQQIFPIVLQVIQAVLPVAIQLISSLIPIILQLAQMVIPMILQVVQMVFPIVLQIIQIVLPVIISLFQTIIPIITQIVMILIPMILQVVQMVFPVVMQIIQMVIPIVVGLLQMAATIITNVLIPAIQFILQVVQVVFPIIMSVIQTALNIITGIIKLFTSVLKGDWSGAWEAVKGILSAAVGLIWSLIKDTFIGKIISTIGEFITGAIEKFNSLKTRASEIFNQIKETLWKPVQEAKDKIMGIIETIKGAFNFEWELPKLKVPKVSVAMKKNSLGIPFPDFDINWNADGILFTKPTVFNTPQGLQGFGEAGPEAALPLTDRVLGTIGAAIAGFMPEMDLNGLIFAIEKLASRPIVLDVEGRELARASFKYTKEFQDFESERSKKFNGG
jgi:phage-related protein